MKTVRFMFDYGCSPVWVYDEDWNIICADIPDDLSDNSELIQIMDELATEYMNLFINNDIEFSYKGFSSESEEPEFDSKVFRAIDMRRKAVNGKYIIEIPKDYQ